MFGEMKLDDNNTVVMKLLHYFITEKDYNEELEDYLDAVQRKINL